MKRVLLLLLLLCLLTACGAQESEPTDAPSEASSTLSFDYQKAADLYDIDTELYDPSTRDVRFRIDDEGYLVSYTYESDGHEIMVTLSYEGRTITVFVFDGNELIDAEIFVAKSDFDREIGMTLYQGFYIRGYEMP